MNSKLIINIALSCVIGMSFAQTAGAQLQRITEPQPVSFAQSIIMPGEQTRQEGSDELQEKVLMQINSGLYSGWLSAAQAAQYKSQLNRLSQEENWYKSYGAKVPAELLEQNVGQLSQMILKLQPAPIAFSSKTAVRGDIDELISKALATKHITSSQAEVYYLRLAQTESNLESLRRSHVEPGLQTDSLNNNLDQMKLELTHKSNK